MQKRRIYVSAVIVTAAGIFTGVLFPRLFLMDGGNYAGLISTYGLQTFENGSLNMSALFPYVASIRIWMLLFLWMSSFTPLGLLLHLVCLFWLGFSAGLLLSVFLLREGYEGILLFCCCVFPQWILYFAVLKKEFRSLCERPRGGTRAAGSGIRGWYREWQELPGMLLLCGLGVVLEVWFGTNVIRILLQYL